MRKKVEIQKKSRNSKANQYEKYFIHNHNKTLEQKSSHFYLESMVIKIKYSYIFPMDIFQLFQM